MNNRPLQITVALFLTALFLLTSCAAGREAMASAEAIEVEGIVLDEESLPVIGATIIVKGYKNRGAVSDINGKFKLTVPKGVRLQFSFIGYETHTLKAKRHMKVRLKESKNITKCYF